MKWLALLLLATAACAQAPAPEVALPDAYHVVYQQGENRLEATWDGKAAKLALKLQGRDSARDPWETAAAQKLWNELVRAKIFEWKMEKGPGAPDFPETKLAVDATMNKKGASASYTWDAPLRNDGQVWALLQHLSGLMVAPAAGEKHGAVPAIAPGATEALIDTLRTELPLLVAPLEPPPAPEIAAALAADRRPALEAAARALEAKLALRPQVAELHALAAVAALELNDPARALAEFSRAAALEPKRADHRHNRGVVLARLGRTRDATRDLEAAHRLAPARFEPAPVVLARVDARSWLGRPGRHLIPPSVDLKL